MRWLKSRKRLLLFLNVIFLQFLDLEKDIIYGSEGYDIPIYDFEIMYCEENKASRYTFSTRGFPEMIEYFGETQLACTNDYDADVVYCTDLLFGNCTSWTLSDDSFPGSSTTMHGGLLSMKSPAEFWGTDNPNAFWSKGNSTVRNVSIKYNISVLLKK
jgi:hypothetical protein